MRSKRLGFRTLPSTVHRIACSPRFGGFPCPPASSFGPDPTDPTWLPCAHRVPAVSLRRLAHHAIHGHRRLVGKTFVVPASLPVTHRQATGFTCLGMTHRHRPPYANHVPRGQPNMMRLRFCTAPAPSHFSAGLVFPQPSEPWRPLGPKLRRCVRTGWRRASETGAIPHPFPCNRSGDRRVATPDLVPGPKGGLRRSSRLPGRSCAQTHEAPHCHPRGARTTHRRPGSPWPSRRSRRDRRCRATR